MGLGRVLDEFCKNGLELFCANFLSIFNVVYKKGSNSDSFEKYINFPPKKETSAALKIIVLSFIYCKAEKFCSLLLNQMNGWLNDQRIINELQKDILL